MIVNQHKLIVAVCFILCSLSVHAASLGRLTAISGLGEPLIAEIDLDDVNQAELSIYSARLATEDAYIIQGIKKSPIQSDIKVDVVKKYNGSSVLKLYSAQPISDQSLNLLIQLDWPSGRMLKEYLLVLESLKSLGSAAVTPPVVAAKPSTPLNKNIPSDAISEANAKSKVIAEDAALQESKPSASGPDYVAGKGDTLSKIAAQMQVEGMSLDQMVRALYEANKDAFIDGDINRLKAGATIKMPAQAQPENQPAPDTGIAVKSDDWSAYRHKVAAMAAESTDQNTSANPADNKIKSKVEEQTSKAPERPRDVLRLSKTDQISDQSLSKIAQLTEEKEGLEEELTVGTKKLDEASNRIKSLEKQVNDLQNLLALSNKKLMELQGNEQTSKISLFYDDLKKTLNQPSDSVMMIIAVLLIAALVLLMYLFRSSKPKPITREEPTL